MSKRQRKGWNLSESPYLRGSGEEHWISVCEHLHRCPWCRRKTKKHSHLEFYSISGFKEGFGYTLMYPDKNHAIVAVVSHAECGPDCGYPDELDELAKDPTGWFRHINQKNWAPRELEDCIWDTLLLHRRFAYDSFRPRDWGKNATNKIC